MKKVYSFLALGAAALLSVTSASARYWTYDRDNPVTADQIEEGKNYVLRSGRSQVHGEYWLLNGQNFIKADNFEATTVYQFVATGKQNAKGFKTYYLKRASDDQYLSKLGNGQFYTSQVDRAWELTVKDAFLIEKEYQYNWTGGAADGSDSTVVNAYSGNANNESQKSNGAYWNINAYLREMKEASNPDLYDLSAISFTEGAPDPVVVIADAVSKDPTDAYSTYNHFMTHLEGNAGDAAIKGENYGRNVWVIYEASELSAKATLEARLEQLLAEQTLEEKFRSYERGEGAGQYSATKYNEMVALFDEAKAIVDGSKTATDTEIDSLVVRLPRALDAFTKSGKPLTEGYYIIRSWRGLQGNFDGGAIYDGAAVDPSNKTVRWSYTKSDDVLYYDTLQKDYKTAKFIWQVIKDPANPGYFFFKNAHTGRYIGNATTVSTPVTSTEKPEYSYNIDVNPEVPGTFSFYSPKLFKGGGEFGGLHTEGDRNGVVGWHYRTQGSSWRVLPLTEEEVAALTAEIAPLVRVDQAKDLLPQAKELIPANNSYVGLNADGSRNENSISGSLELDGLVTDASALACPMADPDEGQNIGAFLDGDLATFFHSSWHSGDNAWTGDHYLQITLPAAEQEVLVKWIKRFNGQNTLNAGAPLKVEFWGTNDESKLALTKDGDPVNYDAWKTSWDSLATSSFRYDAAVQVTTASGTSTSNGSAGVAYGKFAQPYKYLRVAVKTRFSEGDTPNGNRYFHGSELRVYRGQYDASRSINEAIPATVKDNLTNAIAALEAQVAAGAVSEEAMQAVRDAMKAYQNAVPNVNPLKQAIANAKTLINAAVEGTTPGYYAEGSKDVALAAVNAVEAKLNAITSRPVTLSEITDFTAELNAATAAFDAKFLRPENGIYFLRSNSSNASNKDRLVSVPTAARKNYVITTGTKQIAGTSNYETDGIAEKRLGSFWKVEKQDTGYTVKNLFTGLYLAPMTGVRALVQSDTAYIFSVKYAKTEGCFNLVIAKRHATGDHVFVNADPQGLLVTWNSAEGRDNSAFKFEDAEDALADVFNNGFYHNLQHKTAPQIITLPVSLNASYSPGFYSVIGQDADNNIQLREETGVINAGQAYVYFPDASNTESVARFFPTATSLAELVPVNKVLAPVNGLVGVFENTTPAEESGLFNSDRTKVLISERGEEVSAGTGYFTKMPATTEAGAKFIPTNGKITGIVSVVLPNGKLNTGIYNLSGVRFNSSKNLPAGVYVVNGKKVVVKN